MKNLLRAALATFVMSGAGSAYADEPISYQGPVTLPTGVTANGKIIVTPQTPLPTVLTGYDSVTGLICVIGASPTCQLSVSATLTLSNYAQETGGNLDAIRIASQAQVAALSSAALVAGNNGTTGAAPGNPFDVRIGDGSNQATVKAASTAAATTDKALVVSQSPNVSTPCSGTPVPVNQAASTDLKTFTNTGHICSVVLVSAAAQNVSLVYGTGSTCATGTVALIGSTTADATHGVPLGASGGFSAVSDRVILNLGASAQHLCLLQSGSALVAGFITVADQ
jgi:hypothetical protein